MRTYDDGITPAHAGKTKPRLGGFLGSWDHPRACGENQYANKPHMWGLGSPPRMRGKHDKIIGDIEDFRITPAHAGKT